MADATALLAEAVHLAELIGPAPGEEVTEWDEDFAHWKDRHEMATEVLALFADFDTDGLRDAAMSPARETCGWGRILLAEAALVTSADADVWGLAGG